MKKILIGSISLLLIAGGSVFAQDAQGEVIQKYKTPKDARFNLVYNENHPSIEGAREDAKRRAKELGLSRCQFDIPPQSNQRCVFMERLSKPAVKYGNYSYGRAGDKDHGAVTYTAIHWRIKPKAPGKKPGTPQKDNPIKADGSCDFAVPDHVIEPASRKLVGKKIFGDSAYANANAKSRLITRVHAKCAQAGYTVGSALPGYPHWEPGSDRIHRGYWNYKVRGEKWESQPKKVKKLTTEEIKAKTCAKLDVCLAHYAAKNDKVRLDNYLKIYKVKNCGN